MINLFAKPVRDCSGWYLLKINFTIIRESETSSDKTKKIPIFIGIQLYEFRNYAFSATIS